MPVGAVRISMVSGIVKQQRKTPKNQELEKNADLVQGVFGGHP